MATIEYQPFFQGEAGTGFRESGSKTDRSGSGRKLQAVQLRVNGLATFFVIYDVKIAGGTWLGRVSTLSGEGTIRGDATTPERFVDAVYFDLVDLPIDFNLSTIKYQVKWANEPDKWSGYCQNGEVLSRSGVGIVGLEVKFGE